jgi:alpha-ketoglutarate-dependent taurine dioxygenase
MTQVAPLDVIPLTGTLAGEVRGVDLALVDDDVAAAINAALLEHAVLVFRGQRISKGEHVALARLLGEPTLAHPIVPGPDEHPEILELDAAAGGRNARWHTDVTFVAAPPRASILFGETIPPFGGDTMWADQRAAYDRLAPPVRDLVDRLDAVHRVSPLAYWGEPFDTALTREDAAALAAKARDLPAVIHPVVRVHPETGRKNLFVNPGFTTHIVGLSRIESDNLLTLLFAHAAQPEVIYRHRWQTGDLVMWDNRCTSHYAVDDYRDTARRVRRVTLRGEPPVGANGTVSHVIEDPLIAIR